MFGIVNPGVAIGLHTLNVAETNLQRALSQASTGKTVATVVNDPAAFVIASRLNSDASAYMAVRSSLGGAEVPTRVASAAIDGITAVVMKLNETAIEAQFGGDFAAPASAQIQTLLTQVAGFESDATVNGVNLVAGAVGNGVSLTRIRVPTNLDGGSMAIGDMGLSRMNASVPGLGLDNFSGTTDGLSLDFSSLSVENLSTAPPPSQVQVQTANYGTGETSQYPGESWTFVFTDAPASNIGIDHYCPEFSERTA